MRVLPFKAVLPCATLLLVTSCIDDNYDLSDIDTTTQVQVKDLTLPINIDAITLDDILSVDEGDQIHEVTDINGKTFYAFTESGEFKSDPIFIRDVTISAPYIMPASTVIKQKVSAGVSAKDVNLPDVHYDITEISRSFDYETHSVDKSIRAITSAKTKPVKFAITISSPDITIYSSKAVVKDLKIQMMKGLTATASNGSYDTKTGVWNVGEVTLSGTSTTISITATVFDCAAAGIQFNADTNTMIVPGDFTVISGALVLTPKSQNMPSELTFNTAYSVGDIDINSFSGRVSYTLEGMDVSPISVDNIPDFLDGDGTNIVLSNPQIYLSVNNPVAGDKLKCQTGLTLTAKRPNSQKVPDLSYSAAEPVTIGYDKGVTGPYNFVLAPNTSSSSINILDSKFNQNLTGVSFPGLGNILSVPSSYGESNLPDQIEITLNDPKIVESDVVDFELGRNIEGVDGSYEFVAPLALGDGSTIIYSGVKDGWNDEDVDAITITSLTVTANVTNNIPLEAEVKAYPLDKDGNRISGVTIEGATVKAGAVDSPITITMTGTITHLDGINYVATVHPGDDQSLTPQQTIVLTNIRAKVSGSYTKEL